MIPFIVAAIVLIGGGAMALHNRPWVRADATTYLGDLKPKINGADGNIRYIGDYDTQLGCETACADGSWCKAYTWGGPGAGTFTKQCYGMSNIKNTAADPNFFSGHREKPSSTLMRRMGMENAGKSEKMSTNAYIGSFDSMRENYSSNGVATGTMYTGYYGPSTLPI